VKELRALVEKHGDDPLLGDLLGAFIERVGAAVAPAIWEKVKGCAGCGNRKRWMNGVHKKWRTALANITG
jgi:hypothetical protein